MPHTCHARRCAVEVPPTRLLCLRHWALLPAALRVEIWRHYRAHQEITKDPSAAYIQAALTAIDAIAAAEEQIAAHQQEGTQGMAQEFPGSPHVHLREED